MTHWSEQYVGLVWTEDHDCAWLVAKVLREQFGVAPVLPTGFDWRTTAPDEVADMARDYAIEVAEPFDGAVALLEIRGNRMSLGSHVAVVTMVDGAPWLLHSVEKIGSIFHSADSVGRLQLEVRGWYRMLG